MSTGEIVEVGSCGSGRIGRRYCAPWPPDHPIIGGDVGASFGGGNWIVELASIDGGGSDDPDDPPPRVPPRVGSPPGGTDTEPDEPPPDDGGPINNTPGGADGSGGDASGGSINEH